MNTPQNINFKSEYWKYSPKVKVQSFFSSLHLKKDAAPLSEVSNLKVGLGPSEKEFHVVSLKDLSDEGYVEILSSETQSVLDHPTISKAKLDHTLSSLSSNKKRIHLKFIKALPSSLWIQIDLIEHPLTFSFEHNANLLFFEGEGKPHAYVSDLNFEVEKSVELNVGYDLKTESSAYAKSVFHLEEHSNLNVFTYLEGVSDYKRFETLVYQKGECSQATVNGLSLPSGSSVFDYHSDVFHLSKNQSSTQYYNSINVDKSKTVFGGRFHLSEQSAGAHIEQLNQNLLLDAKASVDTQPELNIYNDDVKASHGATTGNLDEEHFFYLMSRGFTKKSAKKFLTEGFARSTSANLPTFLKSYFYNRISEAAL